MWCKLECKCDHDKDGFWALEKLCQGNLNAEILDQSSFLRARDDVLEYSEFWRDARAANVDGDVPHRPHYHLRRFPPFHEGDLQSRFILLTSEELGAVTTGARIVAVDFCQGFWKKTCCLSLC